MKFAFINTGTKQSNAGIIRCLGLGQGLVLRGHEVIILISNDQENIEQYGDSFEGIRFIYVTSLRGGFEQLHKTYQLALLKGVDVVHCMGAGSSIFLPALIAKLLFRKTFQLIVDYEDKQVLLVPLRKKRMHLLYESLSFKYADKILCASQELTEEYKSRNDNTFYLPFAVNSLQTQVSKADNTNKTSSYIEIGYLGSINEAYKDQIEYLITIFPALKTHLGAVKVNIAGSGSLLNFFINKVKALGYENEITFHGFIADADLSRYFSKIDVMFFYFPDTPLNRYRCPNKVFLCCSYGLPIVANNIGEVGKLLENYPNAFIYNGTDYNSPVNAIKQLCQLKREVPQSFYYKNGWAARVTEYLEIVNI